MKTLTKYQSTDGIEFDAQEQCADHENLIIEVNQIMVKLPKAVDNINHSNGGGYIQHKPKKIIQVRNELLEIVKKHINHKWVQQTIDDPTIHPSYVGRLISDYNITPLNSAWHRFMCIDKFSREWGQMFYAINPSKGEQIKLN